MDAIVRAFASDDDDMIVGADEGGAASGPDAAGGDADDDGEFGDPSKGSGGASGDALGDWSD